MPLPPGTRLGNYEVLSELGSGGMGEVYKARDLKLGREVAIKVLPQDMASDSQRLRRFEQEARAASALNHPNIVTIYEIGEHEGTPYIAMEYVDGVTLREMLSDGEPLPTKKLLKLSTQIADGLAKAHSAGIVHRDLKPENLMVTQDGFVKILDFGLAKLVAESSGAESKTVTKATQEGAVLGTVQYMSPEQAAGRPVDYRSDQFSLGSILYEMATGKLAYLRETGPETQAAIMRDEPEPITVLNPHVPAQLTHIIERCLEKEPHERYDSTRDLARDLESVDALGTAPQASSSGSRRLLLAGVSGFVLVVTLVVMALFTGDMQDWIAGDKGPPRIESIAVLPLENLSGDPEQEYFADGMTDELIAELAQIGALKVISRTSIMQYKGARKPLPEIARELDVDAIVEGTVRRAEGRVRITAQLIRAETDQHLWAESYDRELLDILSLQSEVARAIAQEVQVRLTPQEVLQLANTRPVNAEAHEAYLRGRYFWNEAFGTPRAIKLERLNAALESFRQAIALDTRYARGYAGLAETYIDLAFGGLKPHSEVYPLAERAASTALELDETLADAHRMLGIIRDVYEWNYSGAEDAYERALELAPSDGLVYLNYSFLLSKLGRHAEAIAAAKRGQQLDPLNLIFTSVLSERYRQARQHERALEQAKKLAALDPYYYWAVGWAYEASGNYQEALDAYNRVFEEPNLNHAHVYAMLGRKDEARSILASFIERRKEEHIGATEIATSFAALGEIDLAFDWLETAYEEHDPEASFLTVGPRFDPLRDDPRFQDLLRRMNLPER